MTPGPEYDAPSGLSADSGERYERGELIATGGMGQVWRARDRVLGREVAVKVLKHEYAGDPSFRARFAAEARHAAGLHHPGIASVFDYGVLQEGHTPYLVMELVHGKPLSELLARRQPFDPEQARLLALQTAEALAVAHAAGVVHRDVKPANLLVTPEGRVKITDFGIARAMGSAAITRTGEIIGTPHYLSPEQAHGRSATAASDVYALGVVLFECLSGDRPFDADTPIATALAHIQQEVPPLPDSVPPALAAVVRRALSKEPEDRFADGAELAAALRGAEAGAVPAAAVPVPGEETRVLPPTVAPAVAPVGATGAFAPETAAGPAASPAADGPGASRGRGRSRLPLYVAGALLLLLVVGLAVARPWEQQQATTAPDAGESAAPAETAPETVEVVGEDYVGKPADEVESELGDLGLDTAREQRENPGTEEAGTVADLDPTGQVEQGATITVQVWGEAPAEEPAEEPAPDESADDQDDKGDEADDKAEEKAQKEAEKAAEEARKEAEKAAEDAKKGQGGSEKGNGGSDG